MSTLRMTSDLRRQLILGAAKRCFARNGFAGTTTKSVAAAAAISEGLLFKHFPSKAALYAEILAEECEADPDLAHLLGQEPSTATLVELIKGMVGHFMRVSRRARSGGSPAAAADDHQPSRRRRIRAAALRQDRRSDRAGVHRIARKRGRGRRRGADRQRAAQPVLVRASHRADGGADAGFRPCPVFPTATPPIWSGSFVEFILRGIGLNEAAIASHLDRELSPNSGQSVTAESA